MPLGLAAGLEGCEAGGWDSGGRADTGVGAGGYPSQLACTAGWPARGWSGPERCAGRRRGDLTVRRGKEEAQK